MKKALLIIVVITTVLLAGCGDAPRRIAPGEERHDAWVFEGWACAPDSSKALQGQSLAEYCKGSEKKDYLYMKFSAAASQKFVDSGDQKQMMTTCREAARLQISVDGLARLIGELEENGDGLYQGPPLAIIVSEMKGKLKQIGIYDCCSIDNDTGACTKPGMKEDWSQCVCVGYMEFPGGQKAFEKLVREAKDGQY